MVVPADKARLALRLVEFNLHPVRFAHPSWYDRNSIPHAFGDLIAECHGQGGIRFESQVSDWLRQELNLQECMDWEMSEPQKRLWLLDRSSLERLAQELALAMHREWLVQVIDAVQLRGLQAKVDARALSFVIEEVPHGSFHYQSPIVCFASDSAAVLGAKLQADGARTLMALLQPSWRAVRARAQLFFERTKRLDDVQSFTAAYCDRALELICGRLIPRRFSEWAWCF